MLSCLFLFQTCTNDGNDVPQPLSENEYLTDVTTERRFTKAEVIRIVLYHSKTDDFVPYANVEAAHAKWEKSTIVELSSNGHVASGMEFMLKYMKIWDLIKM